MVEFSGGSRKMENQKIIEQKTENFNDMLVLDTNILLLDAENIITLGNNGNTIIVLPETVLEEIDNKKTLIGSELGYQARQFGRIMTKAKFIKSEVDETKEFNTENVITTYLELENGNQILFISFKQSDTLKNDKKIINTAIYADKRFLNKVTLMTNDIACKIIAASNGLNVTDLRLVDDVDLTFYKNLEIENQELYRNLYRLKIDEVDHTYSRNFHNYKFINTITGDEKLATIVNKNINIITKETEKELRKQDVSPKNSEQLLLAHAIINPKIDIVVVEAKAGSGKTVSAVSNAIKLMKLDKTYEGITYIRNSIDDVEHGEDVGYLSGNDEKQSVYTQPLYDTVNFVARERLKSSNKKGEEFEEKLAEVESQIIASYNIKATWTLGLRGRTIINEIVIIDEAQNISDNTMQKVLTRIGSGCKVIIIGSNRQIDNAYLTKYTNGMSTMLNYCSKEENEEVGVYAIQLRKILRSKIAEFAENVYTK
jgi:PhoH-like ATPase